MAQDRFIRLHTTFPPPKEAGQQQEQKGEVLDKTYMKIVPTVIIVDPRDSVEDDEVSEREEDDEDNVWEEMEDAESDVEVKGGKKRKSG